MVDHTYRLFGSHLTFAKDVPTHTITDSESLRKLDEKNERWLRFEIELAMRSSQEVNGEITAEKLIETDEMGRDKTTKNQIGGEEVLNLALYD